jgi:hypothetical protein
LAHLVGLGFAIVSLQIDLLLDPFFSEDVMTPTFAFLKTESEQQLAQIIKWDVCVRGTLKIWKSSFSCFPM